LCFKKYYVIRAVLQSIWEGTVELKNKKVYRNASIALRCTYEEKNRLQLKANLYAKGNLSSYLTYAGLNFVPKKSDMKK